MMISSPLLASRRAVLVGLGAATCAKPYAGHAATPLIRIGVLSDMTGPVAVNSGPGSVVSAQLAVEDVLATGPGFAVEVVSADMLNKPDVGAGIARKWFDNEGVDMIVDVPVSAVALAVVTICQEKDKVAVFSGAGLPELTTTYCGPNHFQWTYDFNANEISVVQTLVSQGGDSWFVIGNNSVAGAAMLRGITDSVASAGGRVVGNVGYPLGEVTDFSSFLLQAQASGAKVVCFTNAGQELSNSLKQAHEFGLDRGGTRLASVIFSLPNIEAVGLANAQGLVLTEAFYWDMNDDTRAFSRRYAARMRGTVPTSFHAGTYSGVRHYLRAVASLGVAQVKASGRAVAAEMKRIPSDDPLFGRAHVRADGKFMHPMYVWQVKAPSESRGAFDYYKPVQSIPAEQAFREDRQACVMTRG